MKAETFAYDNTTFTKTNLVNIFLTFVQQIEVINIRPLPIKANIE